MSIPRDCRAKAVLLLWSSLRGDQYHLYHILFLGREFTKAWPDTKGRELDLTSWWKDCQRICGHVLKPLQSSLWSQIIYIPCTWKICLSWPLHSQSIVVVYLLIKTKQNSSSPRPSSLKKSHLYGIKFRLKSQGLIIQIRSWCRWDSFHEVLWGQQFKCCSSWPEDCQLKR